MRFLLIIAKILEIFFKRCYDSLVAGLMAPKKQEFYPKIKGG
jgi:hypothetical protein